MDFPVVLIVVLFAVLVIAAIALGAYFAWKRREALEKWAKAKGYRFSADYQYDFDERYAHFSCLQQGHNRYAYNIIEGTCYARPFQAFDYHYATRSTDSKGRSRTHHHYFSAIIVRSELPLKPLFIREEHFLDKVGEFIGFDDIDFESAEFSREFCVKAEDKRWAFDVIHQETMEFLLHSPRFTIDLQHYDVIAYRSSTLAPEDYEQALAVIAGVLDRLPETVVRELKERQA